MRACWWIGAIVPVFVASCVPYVLPTPSPPIATGPTGRDTLNPTLHDFTVHPAPITHGEPLTFQVTATDAFDAPLEITWSATGGSFNTTSGRSIIWTPPAQQGAFAVTVSVKNTRGGFASRSLNVAVNLGPAPSSPSPGPAAPPPSPAGQP